jgi:hypothetical protein
MQPRIENPAITVPGAMEAMQKLGAAAWRAGVPEEAARHHDKSALAGLVIAIAAINAWNRVNAATRQIAGTWVDQWITPSHQAAQAA